MTTEPFIFGKLPSHGDFVWRGLSPEVRQLWDDWASGEIESARQTLDDEAAFDAAHDQAPVFRFVAGPSDFGEGWRAGAVAASIDSAGRRFLVIMGVNGLAGSEAAALGVVLAERCETALRTALLGALNADEALAELASVGPFEPELSAAAMLADDAKGAGVWWRSDEETIQGGALPPAGLLAGAMTKVAASGASDDD